MFKTVLTRDIFKSSKYFSKTIKCVVDVDILKNLSIRFTKLKKPKYYD